MSADLSGWVDRFVGVKVLVVGDAMLDRYIVGSVDRISPEAPVPILLVEQEFDRMGGAANVAANVATLGGRARLLALVGRSRPNATSDSGVYASLAQLYASERSAAGDPLVTAPRSAADFQRHSDGEAARLAYRCASAGVRAELLPLLPCTIVKTRIVASRQQMIRIDREHLVGRTPEEAARAAATGHPQGPAPLDEAGHRSRAAALEPLTADSDVILVSDYNKGMVDADLMQQLIASRKPVVVDPRPRNAIHYRGVFMMTPNRKEAMEMLGADPRGVIEPPQLARMVAERFETNALITLGAEGMCLAGPEQEPPLLIPTCPREVFDVTGAGDTVAAVMALGIGAACPLPLAARLANAAAQWTVGRVGTVNVTSVQLKEELAVVCR